MALRGLGITITYVAWDTVNNVGKTGDNGNHTLKWIKDGTSSTTSNSPSEVDSTNAPGVYKIVMTSTECTCDFGTLAGKSSASGISIIPASVSFEKLPLVDSNFFVTVGDYADDKDPASFVLSVPSNKLLTDSSGYITVGDYATGATPESHILANPSHKLVTDNTGYVTLSSTGLDQISVADPAGVANTWAKMLVAVWRRFYMKATMTATQIKMYKDDGTTVEATQTISDDGTTQTQGAAS